MPPDDEDDDLPREDIERRRDVRGLHPGLRIALRGPRVATFDAVEASKRSFFVPAGDPDVYQVGEHFEATVSVGASSVECKLEVMRREHDPRRGVALRVTYIDAASERALHDLLGPLGEG